MIADTHAHLDTSRFDSDREEVIARARDAGLELVINIGTGKPDDPSVPQTLNLAQKHDFIYAALGVHPHDAQLVDESYLRTLESLTRNPKVVLWGEIGLDYYYDNSPRATQLEVLRWQLRAAIRRQLPVVIHVRDAWQDLVRVLREEWSGNTPGGILHSFSGSREQALEGVSLGFLISFSGIVTFKSAERIREAARAVPIECLLVETDCPYLTPPPHRGKRNEPAFVVDVARSLAGTLGVPYEELARQSTRNIRRLIGLEPCAGLPADTDGPSHRR